MEESNAQPAPDVHAPAALTEAGGGGDVIFMLGADHEADSGLDLTGLSACEYKVDGSDSGVEAGSVRGATPAASCDSSLLSCCSDSDDPPPPTRRSPARNAASTTPGTASTPATRPAKLFRGKGSPSGTGSGSSSTAPGSRGRVVRPASAASSASGSSGSTPRTRSQPSARARASSGAGATPTAPAKGQGRRTSVPASGTRTTPVAAFGRCASATPSRRDKANAATAAAATRRSATPTPTSTPTSGTPASAPGAARTPATPVAVLPATSPRGTPPTLSTCSAEARHVLATYATLPRRSRRRALSPPAKIPSTASGRAQLVRSLSASREPPTSASSLVRAASLRRPQQHTSSTTSRSLPPYPRPRVTRRVYSAPSGVTTVDAAAQTDALSNADEVRHLEAHIHLLTEGQAMQHAESERLSRLLQQEQCMRVSHEEELARTLCRVQALLGAQRIDVDEGSDSLQELEIRVQASDHIVLKQQQEISELQSLCTTLQRDLDKSLAAQKMLLQQQQDQEAESIELQEFLQAEKSTLAEALREAENEISRLSAGFQQSQEECKHLVRISEQRRQENMALQARLGGLGARSEELLLQQGAAVSGAAVQLSGLGSRLEALIEQLITAYNISEKDLEDVIFHNEAYSKSESSVEASPERSCGKTPPQPPNSHVSQAVNGETASSQSSSSFVAAVIGAIKIATSGGIAKRISVSSEQKEDKEHMPQPENGVTNSAHTYNGHKEDSEGRLVNSPSLQDLSQAILERQQSEGDGASPCTSLPSAPALALVDQIVEADNLLTRLLKVLRIVQLDKDVAFPDVQDRAALIERLKQQEELAHNWEATSEQLRVELYHAREELCACTRQLEKAQQLQIPDLKPGSLTGLAIQEVRRQYEVIDSALETLQGIKSVVNQYPSLVKLQQDLEETNFHCLTTLPLVGADVNANASILEIDRIV